MIIDLILDRKDGEEYNARDFYYACLHYGKVGDDITRALDGGTEKDVKKALCDYVIDNDYNKNICKYINSVNWLESKKSVRKSLKESISDEDITFTVGSKMKEVANLRLDKEFDYIFNKETLCDMIWYICDELDADYKFHLFPKYDKYQIRVDFIRDSVNVGHILFNPMIEDISSLINDIENMLEK